MTAAPGDGKSETALEAERVLSERFGTRGFAFLLPTMATSDQMYGRVAGVVARQAGRGAGLTLTHSMNWLNSAYAEDGLGGARVLTCEGRRTARTGGYGVSWICGRCAGCAGRSGRCWPSSRSARWTRR